MKARAYVAALFVPPIFLSLFIVLTQIRRSPVKKKKILFLITSTGITAGAIVTVRQTLPAAMDPSELVTVEIRRIVYIAQAFGTIIALLFKDNRYYQF